jgi:hypothetical protein
MIKSKPFIKKKIKKQIIRGGFEYLSGPVSWYTLEKKQGNILKQIHLFGDYHFSKEGNCESYYRIQCATQKNRDIVECQDISTFIDKSIIYGIENNVDVDIFLEMGYSVDDTERTIDTRNHYVGELGNYYLPFLRKEKPLLFNSKTRIQYHYADIRRTQTDIGLDPLGAIAFNVLGELISENLDINLVKRITRYYIEEIFPAFLFNIQPGLNFSLSIQNVIDKLNKELFRTTIYFKDQREFQYNYILNKTVKKLKDVIKNEQKLSNNIIKIVNQKLQEFYGNPNLRPYFQKILDFIKEKSNILLQRTRIIDQDPNLSTSELFINVYNMYIAFGVLLMDFYAIMKMMITLEESKNNQMLINFCGDNHILNYLDFFSSIFQLKINHPMKQIDPVKRCIYDPKLNKIFPYIQNPEKIYEGKTIFQMMNEYWNQKEKEIIQKMEQGRLRSMDIDGDEFKMEVEKEIYNQLEGLGSKRKMENEIIRKIKEDKIIKKKK